MKKTLALVLVTGFAFSGSALAEQVDQTSGRSERGSKLLARLDQNSDGKLSREELQAKAAGRFDAMDANKDGKLSKDEVAQYRDAKRAERQAQRTQRLQAADTDGNGKWTQAELSKLPERVFAKLDSDKDGSLTQQELEARKSRGHHAGKRGERKFTRADVNKDGVVERAEVLQLADARFTKLDANGDGSVEPSELKGHHKHGKKHGGRCHGADKAETSDKS